MDQPAANQTIGACSNENSAWRVRPDEVLRTIPSKTLSIDDSLTLKDGSLFFLCKTFGDVPLTKNSAEGLYYHDCRFLDGYELRLADRPMETLVSTSARGYEALIEMTNPDLFRPGGDLFAHSEEIGIKWLRRLDEATLSLSDEISLRNFGARTLILPVSLRFRAGFQDIFAVRSLMEERRGSMHPSEWREAGLHYRYDGCDQIVREMWVCPRGEPALIEEDRLVFEVTLGPRREQTISISVLIAETELNDPDCCPQDRGRPLPDPGRLAARHSQSRETWLTGTTRVRSSSLLIDGIIERSLRDLYMLRSSIAGEEYYAAGVPWFATLFGRDSIIAALQMLPYDPSIAKQTLRILAMYQGKADDPWREEEPGKIMHEIRVGELARTGQVPHSPYYGTVDATPLFLILASRYHAWTGDDALVEELRHSIGGAAEWMRAGSRANGYITYESRSPRGLTNQGWKDSEIGIQNRDGTAAEPPIALVEVQAYAYRACLELSDLYMRIGEPKQSVVLRREAQELRERFNHDFWMEQGGCFALALARGGRQADVCSSNAGHALWAGIAEKKKARAVRRRLMHSDMFNGWGIRTLSEKEIGYSPIGYHVGTVWPHDNSLILDGFRRYGFDASALLLFSGMVRAAMHFELYRLPELFAGFSREDYELPVHYPLANKPQAWAAGTIPSMLASLLGLLPEASASRLRVVRPVLPEALAWLELKELHVGNHSVDLRFERTPNGVAVQVQRKDKSLDILVEL